MPPPRLAALAGKVNRRRKKDKSAQKRGMRDEKRKEERQDLPVVDSFEGQTS